MGGAVHMMEAVASAWMVVAVSTTLIAAPLDVGTDSDRRVVGLKNEAEEAAEVA